MKLFICRTMVDFWRAASGLAIYEIITDKLRNSLVSFPDRTLYSIDTLNLVR